MKLTVPEGATTRTIKCHGSNLRYFVFNEDKKQTMLMIHGFTGNHRGLLPFAKRLGDYQIVIPDLPGFGHSTPMQGYDHTVAGLTDCIADFIIKLGLKQPILFGHSLGTVIAARLAATRPELVSQQIVLVSPTASPPIGTFGLRSAASTIGELHYLAGHKLPVLGNKLVHSKTISKLGSVLLIKSKDKQLRRQIIDHHIDDLGFLKHPGIFSQTYRSLNRDGILHYAPKMKQQVLLVAGAKDAVWPPAEQRKLKNALANGTLALLSHSGHLTHFEAPDDVADLTLRFLAGEPLTSQARGH